MDMLVLMLYGFMEMGFDGNSPLPSFEKPQHKKDKANTSSEDGQLETVLTGLRR